MGLSYDSKPETRNPNTDPKPRIFKQGMKKKRKSPPRLKLFALPGIELALFDVPRLAGLLIEDTESVVSGVWGSID